MLYYAIWYNFMLYYAIGYKDGSTLYNVWYTFQEPSYILILFQSKINFNAVNIVPVPKQESDIIIISLSSFENPALFKSCSISLFDLKTDVDCTNKSCQKIFTAFGTWPLTLKLLVSPL